MILKHVDRKDQIVRRPRLAVARLDALADRNRDLGIVAVVLVTGRNPGNNIVTPFGVGVVKVERLIKKFQPVLVVPDSRNGLNEA